jgi:hypothetical protein
MPPYGNIPTAFPQLTNRDLWNVDLMIKNFKFHAFNKYLSAQIPESRQKAGLFLSLDLPGDSAIRKIDDLVKSLLERHPGESRGPEHLEITGFRLPPE